MKALLLVGGKGTRLRSVVSGAPKPMAQVGERSFLSLLVRQLRSQGIRRLVMCTGYLADQIEAEFQDGRDWDVAIEYSRELEAAGTAGAVRLAASHLNGVDEFFVLNGDSFIQMDFSAMLSFHRAHRASVTMAAVNVNDASRYGTLEIDESGRVNAFVEKTGISRPGTVNAGVYLFNRMILESIPEGCASLERDVFPSLLGDAIYALTHTGMFIDIGTPEDYALAQQLCTRLEQAAKS